MRVSSHNYVTLLQSNFLRNCLSSLEPWSGLLSLAALTTSDAQELVTARCWCWSWFARSRQSVQLYRRHTNASVSVLIRCVHVASGTVSGSLLDRFLRHMAVRRAALHKRVGKYGSLAQLDTHSQIGVVFFFFIIYLFA